MEGSGAFSVYNILKPCNKQPLQNQLIIRFLAMFASPLRPLHLPPLIKRLKVVTRGSGHFLEETAHMPARVGLELLFQPRWGCAEMARTSASASAGRGRWVWRSWLRKADAALKKSNRMWGRVIFTSNSDIFL